MLKSFLYAILKVHVILIFLDSSVVEHSAVNRRVVGSNPTRGVKTCKYNTYRFFV